MRTLKVIVAVTSLVATLGFASLAWLLSARPENPVLAYTTDDSFPIVPRGLAFAYMLGPWYQPAKIGLPGSDMPVLNFVLASIGLHGPANDLRAREVAELLVKKGADINAEVAGYAPLHTAIMSDSPETILFLLELGADRGKAIALQESPHFGRSATVLAEHLAAQGKISQRTLRALKSAA